MESSVHLPAPLGPMTARSCPASTLPDLPSGSQHSAGRMRSRMVRSRMTYTSASRRFSPGTTQPQPEKTSPASLLVSKCVGVRDRSVPKDLLELVLRTERRCGCGGSCTGATPEWAILCAMSLQQACKDLVRKNSRGPFVRATRTSPRGLL
eukprot:2079909-Prymnesium_polylepis.2